MPSLYGGDTEAVLEDGNDGGLGYAVAAKARAIPALCACSSQWSAEATDVNWSLRAQVSRIAAQIY